MKKFYELNKKLKNKIVVLPPGQKIAAVQVAADGKWLKFVLASRLDKTFLLDCNRLSDIISERSDTSRQYDRIGMAKAISNIIAESKDSKNYGCSVSSCILTNRLISGMVERFMYMTGFLSEAIKGIDLSAPLDPYGMPDINAELTEYKASDDAADGLVLVAESGGVKYGFYKSNNIDNRGRDVYSRAADPIYFYGLLLEKTGNYDDMYSSLSGIDFKPKTTEGNTIK